MSPSLQGGEDVKWRQPACSACNSVAAQRGWLHRLHQQRIASAPGKHSNGAMLIIILFVLVGIGFYAFIGTAPQEAVQLMLVLFWGFLIIAGLLAEFFY